jgi:uncharacterized phage infection (PIP) family protein YhgE
MKKSKLEELKSDLKELRQSLKAAEQEKNEALVKMFSDEIESYEKEIADEEQKESARDEKPVKEKAEKPVKEKAEKPVKEKAEKPVKEKKKVPDCDELAAAWKKRMSAVKKASGKRTAPIGKILADKMEGVVKSVIAYDKRSQTSNLDLGELKKAVDMLAKGLDKLTEALNADLGDSFIQKFKEDLSKIIKALEEKK